MKISILPYIAWVLTLFPCKLIAQTSSDTQPSLQQAFKSVPDAVKPSVYWYWLNDNVSPGGIEKDVQAMAKMGIGRAFIGNIGLTKDEIPIQGNSRLFTKEWWDCIKMAFRSAREYGIELGLFNSPGWSQSGGPWISPGQSMRYIHTETRVLEGTGRQQIDIAPSKAHFERIAVLAFPASTFFGKNLVTQIHTTTAESTKNLSSLIDQDNKSALEFPATNGLSVPFELQCTISDTEPLRSITFLPGNTNYLTEIEIIENVNETSKTIKKIVIDRTNPSLAVGFIPLAPVIIEIPEIRTKNISIHFKPLVGIVSLTGIHFSAQPMVERVMEKQLAKMFQTPLPLWNEYKWQQQIEQGKDAYLSERDIINLTDSVAANGLLSWTSPGGKWIIQHFGMVPTDVLNSPATIEGRGREIDKMNSEYMQHHFDSFVGRILDSIPHEDRGALKWVVADSYETGSQNWTTVLEQAFRQVYGYDPINWLPVLSGTIIESADKSNRFLWDLRRLIADRISYEYVAGLRKISNKHGLKLWLENYGHWGYPGEFLQYGGQADEVGGEFWNEGDLGSIENRAASSAAHIYGKKRVAAESFTAVSKELGRYPALLKKRGDWSFTEGVNHTLFHVYITQPYDKKAPGINVWFGTEFNRLNTWFFESKGFFDYIRRCNFLLQQGLPVSDVAYFIGEDAPVMTGIRQPELPKGHQFDYINAEAILHRLSVKNGEFVLPDGLKYKILVLPPLSTMRPTLLQKIKTLVMEGGIIMGTPPKSSPSLQNISTADKQVQELSNEIWGDLMESNHSYKNLGKGKVFRPITLEEAFKIVKTSPDLRIPDKVPILFYHRSMDNREIYFISNQADSTFDCSPWFRVKDKAPHLWNATTGETRPLFEYQQKDEGIYIPLSIQPFESYFIVFESDPVIRKKSKAENFPGTASVFPLASKWSLEFLDSSKNLPDRVMLDTLISWTEFENTEHKYFSGSALYSQNFKMGKLKKKSRYFLQLGEVGVLANVIVNGKAVGSVWTAPWEIDITDYLRPGENSLQVKVTNTWVNRMIRDSSLPPDERKTWATNNPYKPTDPLSKSGLMGPVTIIERSYGK